MNRYSRYKFKAKRKDNGEWVYGYYMYSQHDCKEYIFTGNNGYGLNDCREFEYFEIIPETLCQCTGFQDIDGNYIFENDILPMGTSIIDGKEEIIYDTVKYVNGIYEPIAYWKKEVLKVIGNKFN